MLILSFISLHVIPIYVFTIKMFIITVSDRLKNGYIAITFWQWDFRFYVEGNTIFIVKNYVLVFQK